MYSEATWYIFSVLKLPNAILLWVLGNKIQFHYWYLGLLLGLEGGAARVRGRELLAQHEVARGQRGGLGGHRLARLGPVRVGDRQL